MNNTTEFTKIWEIFPEKLEEILMMPHKLFLEIIEERFGKWKMKEDLIRKKIETNFPNKINKDNELRRFTGFSITIYNHHTSNTKKRCYTRWKDISFSPQTGGDEKSSGVKVRMCIRDGYTKEKLKNNGRFIESWGVGDETSIKECIVKISAFDNENFVNFINTWITEFPEKLNAVAFTESGRLQK